MNNSKGQALVEFIMILPVLALIIMAMIDFSNIIYTRYQLENDIDYITSLYQNNSEHDINNYLEKKKIKVKYEHSSKSTTITVHKDISITTPGLNMTFGNPHTVSVDRIIVHE